MGLKTCGDLAWKLGYAWIENVYWMVVVLTQAGWLQACVVGHRPDKERLDDVALGVRERDICIIASPPDQRIFEQKESGDKCLLPSSTQRTVYAWLVHRAFSLSIHQSVFLSYLPFALHRPRKGWDVALTKIFLVLDWCCLKRRHAALCSWHRCWSTMRTATCGEMKGLTLADATCTCFLHATGTNSF